MCRFNFPMCDPETGNTLPTCIKDCQDAYEKCGNDTEVCEDIRVYRNIGFNELSCFD